MKWSRELKIAKRSMRTALHAVSATMTAPLQAQVPFAKEVIGKGLNFPDLWSFDGTGSQPHDQRSGADAVQEIVEFGANPGRLRMLVYAPQASPQPHAPVVVVLHGCGQAAEGFARSTGWIALAKELGFILVMPEQSGMNNQGRCFQWFKPAHTARGNGEALSIREMIGTAIRLFDADSKRVFVVGLSAGGAMAAALLAAYPEVFAGGAVVAGVPVGAASNTGQALLRMASPGPERSPAEWVEQVRNAAPAGPHRDWPRISIWHGAADTVVDPGNADLLVTQWAAVHGLHAAPDTDITDPVARHRQWSKAGRPVLEQWTIPGLEHAYPIDGKSGQAGPHITDIDLSATRQIARFWGLL